MKQVIALVALILPLSSCVNYSEGERAGVVTKFSQRGLFCKTWEGQMSIGFMKDGQGTVSKDDWEFTVEDPAIVSQIKAAVDSGKPVKLRYSQELLTFCRADSNNYFVTGVEYIK